MFGLIRKLPQQPSAYPLLQRHSANSRRVDETSYLIEAPSLTPGTPTKLQQKPSSLERSSTDSSSPFLGARELSSSSSSSSSEFRLGSAAQPIKQSPTTLGAAITMGFFLKKILPKSPLELFKGYQKDLTEATEQFKSLQLLTKELRKVVQDKKIPVDFVAKIQYLFLETQTLKVRLNQLAFCDNNTKKNAKRMTWMQQQLQANEKEFLSLHAAVTFRQKASELDMDSNDVEKVKKDYYDIINYLQQTKNKTQIFVEKSIIDDIQKYVNIFQKRVQTACAQLLENLKPEKMSNYSSRHVSELDFLKTHLQKADETTKMLDAVYRAKQLAKFMHYNAKAFF